MKKIFIVFSFLVLNLNAFSQDLKSAVENVKKYTKEIKLAKETISQELSYEANTPGSLNLKKTFSEAKGKSSSKEYSFDLSFFDISQLKREASKSEILVIIKTSDKLSAVQVLENGVLKNFENAVEFHVDNADDARELEKYLKEAIKIAKTEFENSLKIPATLADQYKVLEKGIRSYDVYGQVLEQKIIFDKILKDRAILNSKLIDNGKTEELIYDFSFADLSESLTELNIKGRTIAITALCNDKNKYIRTTEKNKVSYDKEIKFYVEGPKEAKLLSLVLQKTIGNAKKELQARVGKESQVNPKALAAITDFQVNESQFTQSIGKECVCEYKRNAVIKGKSSEETFTFNWGDLQDFEIDVKKEFPIISAKTVDKLKFIALTEKNNKKSFEKEIDFYVADIEGVRALKQSLPALSKSCKQNVKGETFQWLSDKLKNANLDGISQKLELQEAGNQTKWRITVTETGGKKSSESVYEFNISDLDVSKNDFVVKGQNLALSIVCKDKEKLIKVIEDGKPSFQNEILILVSNAEDIKKINATIKGILGKKNDGKI
jgi:hypothetical protein